ncbi:MAG TPA: flagellar biosynthetic protein FliO [Mycobacteriales bacterium]|nr:flagellar biosynthetic protein FliO [Mycobacteriales bacterium]
MIRVLAVIALLAGFLWWLRRYDRRAAAPTRRRPGRPVEVLGQARLSRQATVAVVRVGERSLTLGVTDHGVNLLAESEYVAPPADALDEATVDAAEPAGVRPLAPLAAQVTTYWRRITTRVPAADRPTFAAALQLAATTPKQPSTKGRGRTEGSARPPGKKVAPAAGTRRSTAAPARKPEPLTPS